MSLKPALLSAMYYAELIFKLLRREIVAWTPLGLWVSLSLSLVLIFNQSYLLTDLASHFRFQYFLLGLCATLLFTLSREKYLVLASLLVVGINLPWVYPYLPFERLKSHELQSERDLRILLANVNTQNRRSDQFLELLNEESPDVAIILEINSKWSEKLKASLPIYSSSKFYPREDNFGIAVLSKYEFRVVNEAFAAFSAVPQIDIELSLGEEQLIRLLGIHPFPPVSPMLYRKRNAIIREAALRARDSKLPTIVAGDFNTTMWSPAYEHFLEVSGLHDPRQGRGILSTWPAVIGLPLIPIDHAFYSLDFQLRDFRTLTLSGSDHRGLLIELSLSS